MIDFSKIIIGCHKFQGGFELNNNRKIVDAAISNGINKFDTAPRYQFSEETLGKILIGRQDIKVYSKVGLSRLKQTIINRNLMSIKKITQTLLRRYSSSFSNYYETKIEKRYFNSIQELKKQKRKLGEISLTEMEIKQSVKTSLKNLKRDNLHVLFVHEPDQFANQDEILGILEKLRKEGYISNYGLAYHRQLLEKEINNPYPTISMFDEKMLTKKYLSDKSFIHGLMGYYKFMYRRISEDSTPKTFLNDFQEFNYKSKIILAPSNINQIENLLD